MVAATSIRLQGYCFWIGITLLNVFGCGAIAPCERAIGDLPASIRCINSIIIRNGIDTCYLVQLDGNPKEIEGLLTSRHQMSITDHDPMTTTESNRPNWWPREWSEAANKLAWTDMQLEQYRSAWWEPGSTSVFVEYGQW